MGKLYKEKECPNRDAHTPHPTGYIDHHEWATRKAKTHVQLQCPECKFWAIWVKKPKSPAPETGENSK